MFADCEVPGFFVPISAAMRTPQGRARSARGRSVLPGRLSSRPLQPIRGPAVSGPLAGLTQHWPADARDPAESRSGRETQLGTGIDKNSYHVGCAEERSMVERRESGFVEALEVRAQFEKRPHHSGLTLDDG